jgi:hypothetical protein
MPIMTQNEARRRPQFAFRWLLDGTVIENGEGEAALRARELRLGKPRAAYANSHVAGTKMPLVHSHEAMLVPAANGT